MSPIPAAGLLIGVFCGLWTFVMGFTGWYKDPVMLNAFWVVVLVQLFGLVWGLRQTARQGRGWASQVVAGTLMSAIAGTIVFVSSLLLTTLVFPDYFSDIERTALDVMRRQGKSEAEIARALAESRVLATPMHQAMAGFTATLITGIVASAAIALVVRARPGAADGAERTTHAPPPPRS